MPIGRARQEKALSTRSFGSCPCSLASLQGNVAVGWFRRRMLGLNDESPAVPHAAFARGFLRLSGCGRLLPLSRDTATATSHLPCFLASLLPCPVPHTPACQRKVVQRPLSYAGIFLLVLYWPVVDRLFPPLCRGRFTPPSRPICQRSASKFAAKPIDSRTCGSLLRNSTHSCTCAKPKDRGRNNFCAPPSEHLPCSLKFPVSAIFAVQ
jgi:hypothetical protein